MRRHFERQHENLKHDWDKTGFVDQLVEQGNIPGKSYLESKELQHISFQQGNTFWHKNIPENYNVQTQNKNITENEHVINLMHTENGQLDIIKNNNAISEISPLNIIEENDNRSESVLTSAYIYDDDGGDIMFYVLQ